MMGLIAQLRLIEQKVDRIAAVEAKVDRVEAKLDRVLAGIAHLNDRLSLEVVPSIGGGSGGGGNEYGDDDLAPSFAPPNAILDLPSGSATAVAKAAEANVAQGVAATAITPTGMSAHTVGCRRGKGVSQALTGVSERDFPIAHPIHLCRGTAAEFQRGGARAV